MSSVTVWLTPMDYRIYGRKEYSAPLEQLGRLAVDNAEAVREKALHDWGTAGWVELVAVPESAVVPVISPSKEASKG